MDKEFKGYYQSPIGIIEILAKNKGIFSINFVDNLSTPITNDLILNCTTQLDNSFKGLRKDFDIDMFYNKGTNFQIKVWDALKTIPYGSTCSYKEIAYKIKNEKAVRAVGGANNKNNLAIIIPCHRVIGINGNLIGYNGGLWKKEWLLNHEAKFKDLL